MAESEERLQHLLDFIGKERMVKGSELNNNKNRSIGHKQKTPICKVKVLDRELRQLTKLDSWALSELQMKEQYRNKSKKLPGRSSIQKN